VIPTDVTGWTHERFAAAVAEDSDYALAEAARAGMRLATTPLSGIAGMRAWDLARFCQREMWRREHEGLAAPVLSVREAAEIYAESTGVSAESLTREQKADAYRRAVLASLGAPP
jgi:hypothetical protein